MGYSHGTTSCNMGANTVHTFSVRMHHAQDCAARVIAKQECGKQCHLASQHTYTMTQNSIVMCLDLYALIMEPVHAACCNIAH